LCVKGNGDATYNFTLTTWGTGDLTLSTNSGTDSGVITIADAANGNIAITPNGSGEVDISKVDIDAGAIDGVTIGSNAVATIADIDNIQIDGSVISSTDENGAIYITPNGTGDVNIGADTVMVGDNNSNAVITTQGTGDLTLSTNSGTTSGVITIADGENGNIAITPNGSGEVDISKVDIDSGAIDGTPIGAASASTGAFTTLTVSTSLIASRVVKTYRERVSAAGINAGETLLAAVEGYQYHLIGTCFEMGRL